ncbi:hypothetical protein N7508_011031 [Penicillium antarcticum]|uniref:uncharacterized protein n=1 Tax=Penicillium antarcticum TaxID=416450 RepID=UPI002382C200|nr:uncharacterized protein N7508_011031 [Penicillium antarcticum]KAJ5296210.1 hypothetical protein N7508_011031 [Penicillium antarcticum]
MNLLVQDKDRIAEAEVNCIHEAQQTARLLHNVVDEQSLVHDFPWWQMISCLICASSILFVAESFCSSNSSFGHRSSARSMREDAETCLKVFKALSVNSAAAHKAANMLEGLSQIRRSNEEAGSANTPSVLQPASCLPSNELAHPNPHLPVELAPFFPSPQLPADIPSLCEWPSEISNAMEWSVRFLDYPHFTQPGPPVSTE